MVGNLDEYQRRRDFERTSEPEGAPAEARDEGLSFVIHEHDATRLHYDVRLEWRGVLMSWAVPKGPSLDPADKRLAVQVEDHPLDYGDFEGVIPEGSYGAGPVIVWDRGTWIPDGDVDAALEKGELTFRLDGEKLQGAWRLKRTRRKGKKPSWLLMKRNDEHVVRGGEPIVTLRPESVASGRTVDALDRDDPLPADIQPQLAEAATEAPTSDAWLSEIKLDGYRLRARRQQGRVLLRSRGGLDWTDRYAPIAEAIAALPGGDLFLDGELVVKDADGRTDFGALQASAGRPRFVIFDLLYADGQDLRDRPLHQRKARLRTLLTDVALPLEYGDHVQGHGPAFLEQACELGLEGVVCKQADAPYRPGRHGSWRKVLCAQRDVFRIVGFTEPSGSRQGFGSLVLAEVRETGLAYAGKVGTGFDHDTLASLHERLDAMVVDASPLREPPDDTDVHWVRPDLAAHVRYKGLTRDNRLRQAVFEGLADSVPGRVAISNAGRVIDASTGLTKGELARHWEALADRLLPGIAGRPLTLVRCPEGLDGERFYQRHAPDGGPVLVHDASDLVDLAQHGVLELHVQGVSQADPEHPDRLVFDLDPDEEVGWAWVATTALLLREHLEGLGLIPFLRATGGKGLHVVAPLVPSASQQQVRDLSRDVARHFARRDPHRYTATSGKAERVGRIYIDWMRNSRKASAIATWSTRARPGLPVAVPLDWAELDVTAPGPPVVSVREALGRDDPWQDVLAAARPLTADR